MSEQVETLYGRWWLPGEDPTTHGQPGTLSINPDGSATVQLIGGFPPMRTVGDHRTQPNQLRSNSPISLVFGQCGSEFFTLLEAITSNSINGIIDRPERQTLTPLRVLRGDVSLTDSTASVVGGVQLQLDHLLAFSGLSTFRRNAHPPGGEAGHMESSAEVVTPPKVHAQWQDVSFTIELSYTDFSVVESDAITQQIVASQRAELDIRFSNPRTMAEADTISKRMQDLLTLGVNRPCASRSTRYKIERPAPSSNWELERRIFAPEFNVIVYGRQTYFPLEAKGSSYIHDHLFTLDDMSFSELVPKWLNLYDRATTGIQMLLGTRYLTSGFVSTRLTTVCVALEALHTALFDRPRMVPDEFEALLSSALAGVDVPDHRKLIEQALQNRQSYRQRTKDLVRRLPRPLAKSVFGKPTEWSDKITEARNNLAHANTANDDPSLHLFLMLVTQLWLSVVLASELGIGEDRLSEFVESSWGITSRWLEITGQV